LQNFFSASLTLTQNKLVRLPVVSFSDSLIFFARPEV